MFTGLVQSLGTVRTATDDGHGGRYMTVHDPTIVADLQLGESIAVNGVCLTVVRADADSFDFQIGPETVRRTTLGTIRSGHRVNLERALRVGDRIGGHFVSGHVDCVGKVLSRETNGEWETVWFEYHPDFDDLLVVKGSVAIDGVSLTLVDVEKTRFSVMLIPHTLAVTTLGTRQPGDCVNLEFDLLAKHVQKMMRNLTITV
ncbi:MAG: riboflavin synthase [Fimbriiglobus sp.]|jgi:riboflavin synthase|nr:riboflavin synthase [Fimbriiglobus sp.]